MQLYVTLHRHSSESLEAVGALARHVVLKAPDKADYRAVATEAAVKLVMQLPAVNQHHFVLFAARLARTPKVCAWDGINGCRSLASCCTHFWLLAMQGTSVICRCW